MGFLLACEWVNRGFFSLIGMALRCVRKMVTCCQEKTDSLIRLAPQCFLFFFFSVWVRLDGLSSCIPGEKKNNFTPEKDSVLEFQELLGIHLAKLYLGIGAMILLKIERW